jgi:hypothetical protein
MDAKKIAEAIKNKLADVPTKELKLAGQKGKTWSAPDFEKMFLGTKAGKKASAIDKALAKKFGGAYTGAKTVGEFGKGMATYIPETVLKAGVNVGQLAGRNAQQKPKNLKEAVARQAELGMAALPAGVALVGSGVASKLGSKILGSKAGRQVGFDVVNKVASPMRDKLMKMGVSDKVAGKIWRGIVDATDGTNAIGRIGTAALKGGFAGGMIGGTGEASESYLEDAPIRETIARTLKGTGKGALSGAILGGAFAGAGEVGRGIKGKVADIKANRLPKSQSDAYWTAKGNVEKYKNAGYSDAVARAKAGDDYNVLMKKAKEATQKGSANFSVEYLGKTNGGTMNFKDKTEAEAFFREKASQGYKVTPSWETKEKPTDLTSKISGVREKVKTGKPLTDADTKTVRDYYYADKPLPKGTQKGFIDLYEPIKNSKEGYTEAGARNMLKEISGLTKGQRTVKKGNIYSLGETRKNQLQKVTIGKVPQKVVKKMVDMELSSDDYENLYAAIWGTGKTTRGNDISLGTFKQLSPEVKSRFLERVMRIPSYKADMIVENFKDIQKYGPALMRLVKSGTTKEYLTAAALENLTQRGTRNIPTGEGILGQLDYRKTKAFEKKYPTGTQEGSVALNEPIKKSIPKPRYIPDEIKNNPRLLKLYKTNVNARSQINYALGRMGRMAGSADVVNPELQKAVLDTLAMATGPLVAAKAGKYIGEKASDLKEAIARKMANK